MKIQNIKTIHGPNIFSHNPVLVMTLDLEGLAGTESFEVPGFIDRLVSVLPGLREHYCGLGRPGVKVSNTVNVDVSATCLSTSFFTSAAKGAPFSSSAATDCCPRA